MTRQEQRTNFERAQTKGEKAISGELASWTTTLIEEWTAGSVRIPAVAEEQLHVLLANSYRKITRDVLGVPWTQYKQTEQQPDPFDQVMIAVAAAMASEIARRQLLASDAVLSTTRQFMEAANQAAQEADTATQVQQARVARQDLARRLRRHRLVIAVTESGTIAGTAHRTAVLAVTDPLGNTADQIIALLEAGRFNEARRLSQQVSKLARLPLSVSQGELVQYITDVRDELVTPLSQGRIVSQLRSRKEQLDVITKTWETMGDDRVRPSHVAMDGVSKPIEEPFQLAGGAMQQPRDGSLGASLGEIIRCRCMLSYE